MERAELGTPSTGAERRLRKTSASASSSSSRATSRVRKLGGSVSLRRGRSRRSGPSSSASFGCANIPGLCKQMAVYETMSSETVSYTAINSGVSAAELFRERRSVSRAKLLDRKSKTGVLVVAERRPTSARSKSERRSPRSAYFAAMSSGEVSFARLCLQLFGEIGHDYGSGAAAPTAKSHEQRVEEKLASGRRRRRS